MTAQDLEAVITGFTEAVEVGDEAALRSIYSDDVGVWHNFDDLTVSKDQTIGMLMQLRRQGVQFRHTLEEQFVVGDRVIRRQRIQATTAGGQGLVLHVAMFATIEAGRITGVHEYLDSKAVDALQRAVAAEAGELAPT
jgi:ketosteroid isomerase-like protein